MAQNDKNSPQICFMFSLQIFTVLSIILLTLPNTTSSQGTVGRDFFVGILGPWQKISIDTTTILITSPNKTGIFNVIAPFLGINITQRFTGSYEYRIQNSIMPASNNTVESMGIRITSDIDVSIVVITSPNTGWEQAREASLILPTSLLSTTYVVSSYTSGPYWYSSFLVVATESGTVVNITFNDLSTSPESFLMGYLDSLFYESRKDLSGTIIHSNKPIAVFSGHEATAVPKDCDQNHFMAEQLLPTSMFGQEFIVPPMVPKLGYVVRVFGSKPNTTIDYTLSSNNSQGRLERPGQFLELMGEDIPLKIYASKPVQVILYSTCSSYKSMIHIGGSTMTTVPSMQQYSNRYVFSVSAIYGHIDHYLAITANDADIAAGLRINRKRMEETAQISKLHLPSEKGVVNIYKVHVGVYELAHVGGLRFGALQYGFGRNEKAYSNVIGLVAPTGLTCLSCTNINKTENCHEVNECAFGQVCFVENFMNRDRQILYNMGCSDAKCMTRIRPSQETSYLDMFKSIPICRRCCDHDFCNSHCNVTNQVRPEVTVVG